MALQVTGGICSLWNAGTDSCLLPVREVRSVSKLALASLVLPSLSLWKLSLEESEAFCTRDLCMISAMWKELLEIDFVFHVRKKTKIGRSLWSLRYNQLYLNHSLHLTFYFMTHWKYCTAETFLCSQCVSFSCFLNVFKSSRQYYFCFVSSETNECSKVHTCNTSISSCRNTHGSYECDCFHGYLHSRLNNQLYCESSANYNCEFIFSTIFCVMHLVVTLTVHGFVSRCRE